MKKDEKIGETELIAFINNELSESKKIEVNKWISASKANEDFYKNLKKTWDISAKLSINPIDVNTDNAWQNVLSKIETDEKIIDIKTGKKTNLKIVFGIAAMIVVIFTIYKVSFNSPIETVNLTAHNNIESETLEDGSKITLNENSILTYPNQFEDNERRVNLKGEAFFNIERDEKKPFIIDLPNNSYVKVLGTSFNIKANDEDSITTVFVNTGKVEFGRGDSKIILVAGETGIMNNNTNKTYKLIDAFSDQKERYWQNKKLEFKGDKILDVVNVLNSVFDEKTEIICDSVDNLAITASFENKSLDYILKVLAETNGLILEVKEGGAKTYLIQCNDQ